jgi:hypothetical protein
VAPLWLGGLRGKKSTPSVGWEVPVRSHRSQAGAGWSACGTKTTEHSRLAKVRFRFKLLLAMKFKLHMLFLCVWVLLIIMKRLCFYILSLIPLVISLCLSSRPGAESTVVTSVFKDL